MRSLATPAARSRLATVIFDLSNLRRAKGLLLEIAAIVALSLFVLEDAGGVLLTIIMAIALWVVMELAISFSAVLPAETGRSGWRDHLSRCSPPLIAR